MRPGDVREQVLTEDLTRTQIVQYAGASGDYNPVHTDEVFATSVAGYPTVFAHGMLTMGMTARAITDWVGHGKLTRFGVRFKKQVWPGDHLIARLEVDTVSVAGDERLVDLSIVTTNGEGDEVLTGYATVRLTERSGVTDDGTP